ncbi:sensor histidine kinase [Cryptosporangium arvum]|uniref:histidine kinase n=1 Tax=Cryptosporangium arvum DSM 44712 TaxID=927661 RepID=A0A011AEL2_9ACTN|nr:sensor histidine kinase [Cryptosporangium arvum]EXG80476.1 signal transduction histidine kinase [Cryptosporangium arvum DSM 44712]
MRAVVSLATGVVTGAVTAVLLLGLVTVGALTAPVLIGLPILGAVLLSGLPVGWVERRRLGVDGDPHREPDRPGLRAWLSCRLHERASWRELAYALLLGGLLWWLDLAVLGYGVAVPLSLMSSPVLQAWFDEVKVLKLVLVTTPGQAWAAAVVGVLALPLAGYLIRLYAAGRARLARAFLAPRRGVTDENVVELVRSRARLVDAFDAERRRIERDLHDGAQQRLVALGMTLGLARLAGPDEMRTLVERAHGDARRALDELQEFLRGIHPRILTDRGLPAAVAELADRSGVPVDVELELPGRLPSSVEVAAYFVVCEALTNVARHSGCSSASVTGGQEGSRLVVEIRDDGVGGASAAPGSGLAGLADRVAAAAGRLALVSPPGGPTVLRVELPCAPSE